VQGRHAAEELHARLRELPRREPRVESHSAIGPDQVMLDFKVTSPAVRAPRLSGPDRVKRGAREVAATITEQQFLDEVDRCFSCGSCFGCEQCSMFCTPNCFTRLEQVSPGMYFTLSLDQCEECGKCVEVCPCGFLDVIH
jgi:Pyruvate/2-oxoacid:ferredoxin oxidoreductase delta subunit